MLRSTTARRFGLALLVLAALAGSGCRNRSSQPPPAFLGDFRELEPDHIDAAYREDWSRLQSLREADPASPEVATAADALLARNPPVDLKLAAMLAKAEQAYLTGKDPQATQVVDEALSLLQGQPPADAPVVVALSVVRVRAMARSGDPARALVALDEPILARAEGLPDEERRGLRAVALDRAGRTEDAAVAFLLWRSVLPTEDPAAAYAESRFASLASSIPPTTLGERAGMLPASPARNCLELRAGLASGAPNGSPGWVEAACLPRGRTIGLLLPRTGPLSALADTQLAAASVAIGLLRPQADVELRWEDAGSTPKAAAAGATALLSAGVDVIVGPIGPANVEAVAAMTQGRIDVVVPGEPSGRAIGVAPSLEARVDALVRRGAEAGVGRFVVVAPDNPYGRRAVAAIKQSLQGKSAKSLMIQMYPPSTTSFAPLLAPVLPALGKGTAVVVPDHVSRVELVVRQLARSGQTPAPSPGAGTLVLTTAEGLPLAMNASSRASAVFEGLWVAPVAAPTAEAQAFVQAYTQAQGEAPSDQALLVYYALRRAVLGQTEPSERAAVFRLQGGQLVDPGRS